MTRSLREKSPDTFPASSLERSDAELIRDCRIGSQTAWDELVGRYQRLIYAIPRRAGLTDEQSADVFQEVFLTLFEKLDQIEQPEKIRSWIVTTAKFKTWAIVRGSKGLYSPESDEEMEREMANLADAAPLADDMLIELEQQHLIRTALKRVEDLGATEVLEQTPLCDQVLHIRNVMERDCLRRQQCCGEARQRRVLRSTDLDFSF